MLNCLALELADLSQIVEYRNHGARLPELIEYLSRGHGDRKLFAGFRIDELNLAAAGGARFQPELEEE